MAKILIVEDEVSLQEALESKLKSNNHTAIIAGNGEDGLRLALEELPDLILLDLLMPKMTGSEMLTKLRASGKWGEQVKVIVLTNYDPDNDMLEDMSKAAPAYYILKADASLDEVVSRINEVLKPINL